MNGFYILLLILLKTFLVPLPNDLIRFGVPGTINSVLSMAEFNAAFELFVDFQKKIQLQAAQTERCVDPWVTTKTQ